MKKRDKKSIKEAIEKVVLDSGLWNDGQRVSHGFILSPDVYILSSKKRKELESIGLALKDCLVGLSKIAFLTSDDKISAGRTWQMIKRIFRTGVPRSYRAVQLLNPDFIPYLCKVDFIQGKDNKFWISEIDGYNKHGLGYSILANKIAQLIRPELNTFSGIGNIIFKFVEEMGNSREIVLLYADQERFYLPEFKILKQELIDCGINLNIVPENEFKIKKIHQLFIDFPFLSIRQPRESLIQFYKEKRINFLIPPKPFLSSKLVLALLKNVDQNRELEIILKSHIPAVSLYQLRNYIPEVYLINQSRKEAYWQNLIQSSQFIIKKAISSGSKNINFPDDPNFAQVLDRACSSGYNFILQRQIANKSCKFNYFADHGYLKQDNWHIRLTVHFSPIEIAGAVVTARKNKLVHGAVDCLQLGVAIK